MPSLDSLKTTVIPLCKAKSHHRRAGISHYRRTQTVVSFSGSCPGVIKVSYFLVSCTRTKNEKLTIKTSSKTTDTFPAPMETTSVSAMVTSSGDWTTDTDNYVLRATTSEDPYQGATLEDVVDFDPSKEGLRELDPFFPGLYEISDQLPELPNQPMPPCGICTFLLSELKRLRANACYHGVDQLFAAAIVRRHVLTHNGKVPILPELVAFHVPNGTEVKPTELRSLSVYDELRLRCGVRDYLAVIAPPPSLAQAGNLAGAPGAPGAGPHAPSVSEDLPPNPFRAHDVLPGGILLLIAKRRIERHSMLMRQYRRFEQSKRSRDCTYAAHPEFHTWKMRERVLQWMEDVDPVCVDCAGECTCQRSE